MMLRSIAIDSAWRTAEVAQERMRIRVILRPLRALVAQVGVGVGEVDQDALDVAGEGTADHAVALGFHVVQHGGLDLQVPAVVSLAGFQHGAGRGRGILCALDGHFGEVRLVRRRGSSR